MLGNGFREHLLGRNYDPDLYQHHTVDEDDWLLTVHLFNIDGKFVGYQRYNPSGSKKTKPVSEAKYMTYIMKGERAYWGLETLDYTKSRLYIVEGLFKASALHRLGLNAICVMGNNAAHLGEILLSFNMDLVAVCDNDDAGKVLGRSVERLGGESITLEKDVDEYCLNELRLIFNLESDNA